MGYPYNDFECIIHTLFFTLGEPRYAKIPHWMENSGNTNRIVGGQKALRPIPWQAGFYSDFLFLRFFFFIPIEINYNLGDTKDGTKFFMIT